MHEHNWIEVVPEASFMISEKTPGRVDLVSVGWSTARSNCIRVPVKLTGELAEHRKPQKHGVSLQKTAGQLSRYKHHRVTE